MLELKFTRIEKKVNRAFITDTSQIQSFSSVPPYAYMTYSGYQKKKLDG